MNADPNQVLRNAVAAAVMAPSSYNTQPWRFRIVGGTTLELRADPARQLRGIDRDGRQLVQSCGCALYNARVAVRAMGFTDEVSVMLVSEAAHPELLATLHLGPMRIPTDEDHTAIRALAARHTNRRPFLPVPVADVAPLVAAAAREGAWAVRIAPPQKQVLGALIEEADRLQYADPAFRADLERWLASVGSRRRDGIPFVEKEYGSAMPFGVMRALRSPSLGDRVGQLEEEMVEGAPVVLVLGTDSDEPPAWLASGQALEAVLLAATGMELEAAFLNQVLEVPALRAEVGALVGRTGYPQVVLRLGYASEPLRHPAPRRELDEVLEIAS